MVYMKLSPGVKRPKREADHLPTSYEVKNGGYIFTPFIRLHGVVLYYLSTKAALTLLLDPENVDSVLPKRRYYFVIDCCSVLPATCAYELNLKKCCLVIFCRAVVLNLGYAYPWGMRRNLRGYAKTSYINQKEAQKPLDA
jgi:hypothetical protein